MCQQLGMRQGCGREEPGEAQQGLSRRAPSYKKQMAADKKGDGRCDPEGGERKTPLEHTAAKPGCQAQKQGHWDGNAMGHGSAGDEATEEQAAPCARAVPAPRASQDTFPSLGDLCVPLGPGARAGQ